MSFQPFFEGIVLGLTIAILLGPAFFALLQTSIHRGLKSGAFLAVGIFLSDMSLVGLCYLGVSKLLYNPRNSFILGVVGGIVLFVFGLVTFTRQVQISNNNDNDDDKVRAPGPMTFILKGYFLNLANPSVWFFWITVTVGVASNYGVDTQEILFFFSGLFATIFLTDLTKCFIANKIKQFLSPRVMTRVNHVVGILLMLIGVVLMIRAFFPKLF